MPTSVVIFVSTTAGTLQQKAAKQLQGYLKNLFNVDAVITTSQVTEAQYRFVLGLDSDSHVQRSASSLPKLSAQGHLVRRVSPETIVLAGGSCQAVAWAVYELIERYGVRFLLHEDVLPEKPGEFYLPDVDILLEPVHKLRSWRLMCELATGPALWSLDQQKRFINQLFKLKFNGVHLSLWSQQPFIDYECQGIRRQNCSFLLGQKIPITDENIGRGQLQNAVYLTNPEFVGITGYQEMLAAGRRLIHGIIDHARQLGMHTAVAFNAFEFPKEFRGLLQKPTKESIQLGDLSCAERGELCNPGHMQLVQTQFEAYLKEFSEVDDIFFGLPEHPQADHGFKKAWNDLASRFDLEPKFDVEHILQEIQKDRLNVADPKRAEREFKSAVGMLRFLTTFFGGNGLLQKAQAHNTRIGLSLSFGALETMGFLDRVLWPGAIVNTQIDYTASRSVRRMHLLEAIDASQVPTILTITLQDDNIGLMPQVATESNYLLLKEIHKLGWQGYCTRFWPISDLDPTTAFLARASWDSSVTPRTAYADHFSVLYGKSVTDQLCQVMRLLEDATLLMEKNCLLLLFAVPGIMNRFLKPRQGYRQTITLVREIYQQCQIILDNLMDQVDSASGKDNMAYWQSRLTFAIEALSEALLLSDGASALDLARQAESSERIAVCVSEASKAFEQAVQAGKKALQAVADNIRDDSDRGTVAAYYHFLVREVSEATARLLETFPEVLESDCSSSER